MFKKFIDKIDELSPDELNKIPQGFNNNIIWNFGHAVVSSYSLAFIRPKIDEQYSIPYWDKYKLGSKPEAAADTEEIQGLKKLALSYANVISDAVNEGKFKNIAPFATGTFGAELKTADDILTTILAHNAMHYATASAMAKIIKN